MFLLAIVVAAGVGTASASPAARDSLPEAPTESLRDTSLTTPKAVVLGPRLKRHRPEEWDRALAALPRQDRAMEPAQLQRGRIGASKVTSGGGDAT